MSSSPLMFIVIKASCFRHVPNNRPPPLLPSVLHRGAEEEAVVMETTGPEAVPVHSKENHPRLSGVPIAEEVSVQALCPSGLYQNQDHEVRLQMMSCSVGYISFSSCATDEIVNTTFIKPPPTLSFLHVSAAGSASPTPSPPLAVSGAACRPGGAFVSSRCPPGVCPAPAPCWAAGGCWGRRLAAPAASPRAPSRGDR